MKQNYQDLLSKRIDNLPYSVKPKHFKEFKKNLLKRLLYRKPGYPSFLEVMYQCFKEELNENNIYVSQDQMLDHTIMFISLMYGPYFTEDEFEYEMKGENLSEKYYEIFQKPILISGSEFVHLGESERPF